MPWSTTWGSVTTCPSVRTRNRSSHQTSGETRCGTAPIVTSRSPSLRSVTALARTAVSTHPGGTPIEKMVLTADSGVSSRRMARQDPFEEARRKHRDPNGPRSPRGRGWYYGGYWGGPRLTSALDEINDHDEDDVPLNGAQFGGDPGSTQGGAAVAGGAAAGGDGGGAP